MAYEVILHSFAHKKLLQKKATLHHLIWQCSQNVKTFYWDVSIEPQSEMQKRLGWPQGRVSGASRADSLRHFLQAFLNAIGNHWRILKMNVGLGN